MVPATAPLIGFSGEIIWPIGQISLSVKIGDKEHSTSTWMNFVVVRSPSLYNGIIGRLGVRKIQAVPSTTYGMLKFPVLGGILTLRSSKIIPLECTYGVPPTVRLECSPKVLSKPKIARRLQKWSIELREYDIHYRPRVSIKGNFLADFIVERPDDDSLAVPMEVEEELLDP
ncbi:hypothetical protein Tco_0995449 [Tanacetum coccineum]